MAALKTPQNLSMLLNASAILKTGKMKGGLKKGKIDGDGEVSAFLQVLKKNMSANGAEAAGGTKPGAAGSGKETKGPSLLRTAASVGFSADEPGAGGDVKASGKDLSPGVRKGPAGTAGDARVSGKGASPKVREDEAAGGEDLSLQSGAVLLQSRCLDDPAGAASAAGKSLRSPLAKVDFAGSSFSRSAKETGEEKSSPGRDARITKGNFDAALKTESAVPEDSPALAAADGMKETAGSSGRQKDTVDVLSVPPGRETERAKTPPPAVRSEAKNAGGEAKADVRFNTTGESGGKTGTSDPAVAGPREVRGIHPGSREETAGSISRTAPPGRELKVENAPADSRGNTGGDDPGTLKDSGAFIQEPAKDAENFKEKMSVADHAPAKGESKAVTAEGPGSLPEASGLAAAEGSKTVSRAGRTSAAAVPDPQVLMDRIAENSGILMRTGYSRVRLTLSPPRLGTLDLDLSIRRDRVRMVLTAENGEVRQVLQSNMDQLKTTLQDQGLSIDRLDVLVQDRGGDRGQEPSQGGLSFGREQTQQGSERGSGEEQRPAPPGGSYREGFRGEEGISIFA